MNDIERQYSVVRGRLSIIRNHWITVCAYKCRPPIEDDLDILERELEELRDLILPQKPATPGVDVSR